MSLSAISKALRQSVFQRDRGICQYCHLVQVGQAAVFHVNHIIPKSKGGLTDETNLALQCPCCSLHKSDKLTAADPLSKQIVSLFHPLQQQWQDHFALEASGMCRGLSSIGRATVEALRMNDALPLIARSIQIELKLLSPSTGSGT